MSFVISFVAAVWNGVRALVNTPIDVASSAVRATAQDSLLSLGKSDDASIRSTFVALIRAATASRNRLTPSPVIPLVQ
jgi:hypothetical protein